jgi:hypothetical protein
MNQAHVMGAQHAYHPQARVGALVPARRYDLVGAEGPSTWDRIKEWGNKETFGVQRKYLVLAGAFVGLAWYGYHAKWFR